MLDVTCSDWPANHISASKRAARPSLIGRALDATTAPQVATPIMASVTAPIGNAR
jgi:hypothetical protein